MKTTLVVLALTILFAGSAAAKDVEALMHHADELWQQERFEEAAGAYEAVLHEGGVDTEFGPMAFERLARCLARLGKRDHALEVLEKAIREYRGRPEVVRQLKEASVEIGARGERDRPGYVRPGELEEMDRQRREAEERLRSIEKARREMEQRRDDLERKLEELSQMWREHGIPPDEVEVRLHDVRERHERELAAHRKIEALELRLHEEGVPPEVARREVEKLKQRLRAEMEAEWRGGREDDLGEVRREFLHLAERLGIPAEEAERFLEDHERRRMDRPFHRGEEEPRGPDDVMRRMEGLEAKLGRALEDLAHRLDEMDARLRRLEQK
jgi:tetratricopeptide (TPR) repeat protein